MSLTQIWRIVWARRSLVICVFVTVVGLVAIANILAPRKYLAEVALVVDTRGTDPLADNTLAPQLVPAYISTQVEIIRSANVALRVVDDLKLDSAPDAIARFKTQADGVGDIRAWLANSLLNSLDAKPSRNSNIIRISYLSSDSSRAARIANAFADAYMDTKLQLQVDPSRRQSAWLDDQTRQLREELASTQARLDAYQKEHGVIGVDDARMDVENARLQEISNRLVEAQSGMYEANTRADQLSHAVSTDRANELPDVLKQPLLQSLKAELSRAETKLAEVSERYDHNHPQYKSAAVEVTTLRAKLATETEAVRGSIVQSAEMAGRQVAQVQKALDEQRARIIALKQQRDELAVLNRDVESARTAYDSVLKQSRKTRMESRLEGTNIAILTAATAPLQPDSPHVLLNLIIGAFVGGLLGLGIAVALDLHQPVLRSADDLAEQELSVLCELPSAPLTQKDRRRSRVTARSVRLQPTVA